MSRRRCATSFRPFESSSWLPTSWVPATTSLTAAAFADRVVYEQEYCGRGDMENRIKEQQLYLFACRSSCATMRANQVRLLLSTVHAGCPNFGLVDGGAGMNPS